MCSVIKKMSSPSLSIICYKNGFSFVNIPVNFIDDEDNDEDKEEKKVSCFDVLLGRCE